MVPQLNLLDFEIFKLVLTPPMNPQTFEIKFTTSTKYYNVVKTDYYFTIMNTYPHSHNQTKVSLVQAKGYKMNLLTNV